MLYCFVVHLRTPDVHCTVRWARRGVEAPGEKLRTFKLPSGT
jgi:hypothetical protein